MDGASRSLLQRSLRYRGARLRARYRNGGELPEPRHAQPALRGDLRTRYIQTDECGAPAFFSGGAQLAPASGEHARISPQTFARALADPLRERGLHSVQPAALSLTQMTEFGVYPPRSSKSYGDSCPRPALKVQMDGARFANAVASRCHPGDITRRAGVDAAVLRRHQERAPWPPKRWCSSTPRWCAIFGAAAQARRTPVL